jgi:hypothetical protein
LTKSGELARYLLSGPTIMVFSDTLLEMIFRSSLRKKRWGGVGKSCPSPAALWCGGSQRWSYHPPDRKAPNQGNNLALVGCYYFKKSEDLVSAINEQMKRDIQLMGISHKLLSTGQNKIVADIW